jgi:hypothetical protein
MSQFLISAEITGFQARPHGLDIIPHGIDYADTCYNHATSHENRPSLTNPLDAL